MKCRLPSTEGTLSTPLWHSKVYKARLRGYDSPFDTARSQLLQLGYSTPISPGIMKYFSLIPAIGLAVLSAVSVVAQQPSVVIGELRAVTVASANLRDVVGNITIINVPSQGPLVASGLLTIVDTIEDAIKNFDPTTPPYDDDAAADVVDALTLFVEVHQDLLNTIIGKHGILTPVAPGIACALRTLESVVDAFAFAIIGLIPTRHDEAMDQKASLDETLQNAVNVYGSCFS
ncbi:hypothetical protein OH77DRAFT_1425135 [Trametes cingulata]|nr:hypothetical protein OH77DRAFT_1425135 [Trametes cingulata]